MATKAKPKWEIPPRGRTCCRGQESLQADALYYTLLKVDDAGFYQRADYCPACWEQEVQALPANSVYWKATAPKRQNKKVDYAEFGERALLLLREVVEGGDRQSQEEAFVLGLYLQRLRVLAARQEVAREGTDCILYEVLESGEMLTVPKVKLSVAETERLQATLTQKLSDPDSESS